MSRVSLIHMLLSAACLLLAGACGRVPQPGEGREIPVLLNLDTKASVEIMKLFTELSNEGITIVMVTHEDDIAAYAKRHLVMKDGKLVRDDRRAPGAEGGAA